MNNIRIYRYASQTNVIFMFLVFLFLDKINIVLAKTKTFLDF